MLVSLLSLKRLKHWDGQEHHLVRAGRGIDDRGDRELLSAVHSGIRVENAKDNENRRIPFDTKGCFAPTSNDA